MELDAEIHKGVKNHVIEVSLVAVAHESEVGSNQLHVLLGDRELIHILKVNHLALPEQLHPSQKLRKSKVVRADSLCLLNLFEYLEGPRQELDLLHEALLAQLLDKIFLFLKSRS